MTPEVIARVDAWLEANTCKRWLKHDWARAADMWSYRDSKITSPERAAAIASIEASLTGILLALVRAAWGDPTVFARPFLGGWKMTDAEGNSLWCDAGPLPRAATEAEALAAALLAAPAKGAQ